MYSAYPPLMCTVMPQGHTFCFFRGAKIFCILQTRFCLLKMESAFDEKILDTPLFLMSKENIDQLNKH